MENTPTEQTDTNSTDSEIVENSNTKDSSEETAQTEPVNNQEIHQEIETEVKYNPEEDLTAIQQENSAPSESPEPPTIQEEESSPRIYIQ